MLASKLAGIPLRLHFFTGQVWSTRIGIYRAFLKLTDSIIVLMATQCFVDGTSQLGYLKSEFPQRIFRKLSLMGPGPICGVDLDKFSKNDLMKAQIRAELRIPEQGVVALFMGRVSREKGIFELFEAFEDLISSGTSDTYLLVIGPLDGVDIGKINYLEKNISQEKYNQVLDIYLKILDSTRADIPTDLQDYWIKNQDRLGLKGKFLPDNSSLTKYKVA
jgi:glycosyltransferase involved in cell wall biosynthesis